MQVQFNVGLKDGLIIKGGQFEQKVVNKFSQFFLVSFSRISRFKNSEFIFAFLKPSEYFRKNFNLYNEILLLFSTYYEFDSRTLDFVDKLLFDFNNRLDKICIMLVSNDVIIEQKIEKLNNENKESKIIVPFTYNEVLNLDFMDDMLENKFRKYFYSRDLFALESPLKSENYFFGRLHIVQAFYDKYCLGEHSGLFGLRKIGKTSVLFGLERMIRLREGFSIYIDCQDTAVHKIRWYELLFYIIKNLKEKYSLNIRIIDKEKYSEKTASEFFETDLKQIKKLLNNKRILMIFDEIEHISFMTSSTEHWREQLDYVHFWQTLRAIFQKNDDLFCFIIAGVNPLCIEQAVINGYDNPIFSLIKPIYLDLFTVSNVTNMVQSIGSYMGLQFDSEIFTNLTDDYGGHPFLIRHVCSLINSDMTGDRPVRVTKYSYREKKEEYDRKIQNYVELIILVLQKWYPDEYRLLEILIRDGNDMFKESITNMGNAIEHLIGYGIIKEDHQKYFVRICAVEKFIASKIKSANNLSTKEGRTAEISKRRNSLEEQLKRIVLTLYRAYYGNKTREEILKHIEQRDKLNSCDINTIFKEHLYFLELKTLILKNWQLFDKLFNDKKKFETFFDFINEHRIDAHSKDISDEDLATILIAFSWFETKLKDLAV